MVAITFWKLPHCGEPRKGLGHIREQD